MRVLMGDLSRVQARESGYAVFCAGMDVWVAAAANSSRSVFSFSLFRCRVRASGPVLVVACDLSALPVAKRVGGDRSR